MGNPKPTFQTEYGTLTIHTRDGNVKLNEEEFTKRDKNNVIINYIQSKNNKRYKVRSSITSEEIVNIEKIYKTFITDYDKRKIHDNGLKMFLKAYE